jgi:AcrR family transcriptional regulator
VIHEGLVYSSDDAFAAVLVPFLREAAVADQPAFVALRPEREELLRAELGTAAAGVTFLDADSVYARPGATLRSFSAAVDKSLSDGATLVRVVGEPPIDRVPGREERWRRLESLYNRLYSDAPVSMICPYDARASSGEALGVCHSTHPTIVREAGREPSPEYFAAAPGAVFATAVDPRGTETSSATAGSAEELVALRPAVVWPARTAGVAAADAQDLVLAVTELGQAAFAHSVGTVTVKTRDEGDAWSCEVSLTGAGVLAGRRAQVALAIGSIVADRVELASDAQGELVRFVLAERKLTPRERILEAAQDLFGRDGIRGTSVNAIAARANVAKATFYTLFPSKAELVRTWVATGTPDWQEFARGEVEARAETPRERLRTWFAVLAEWIDQDVRAESSLSRIWSELRDPGHDAHEHQRASTAEVRDYLRDLAAAAGAPEPDLLAAELYLLAQGVIVEAVRTRSAEPVHVAASAAARLLDTALPAT